MEVQNAQDLVFEEPFNEVVQSDMDVMMQILK